MLDYYNRVATVDKLLQHIHKNADVLKVESGCRLVEYVKRLACVALAQFGSQFHTLAFTSRQRCRGLSELDISQSYVLYGLYLLQYGRHILEELYRLVDGHIQHVGNALALIAHLKRLAVVAFAVTYLARNHHIGQEVHLYGFVTVALARLAATALHVE